MSQQLVPSSPGVAAHVSNDVRAAGFSTGQIVAQAQDSRSPSQQDGGSRAGLQWSVPSPTRSPVRMLSPVKGTVGAKGGLFGLENGVGGGGKAWSERAERSESERSYDPLPTWSGAWQCAPSGDWQWRQPNFTSRVLGCGFWSSPIRSSHGSLLVVTPSGLEPDALIYLQVRVAPDRAAALTAEACS